MPGTVTRSATASGTAASRSSVEHPAIAGRTGATMAALRSRLRSTHLSADRVSLPAALAIFDARGFMLIGSFATIAADRHTDGGDRRAMPHAWLPGSHLLDHGHNGAVGAKARLIRGWYALVRLAHRLREYPTRRNTRANQILARLLRALRRQLQIGVLLAAAI